jgi:hypothetical protein
MKFFLAIAVLALAAPVFSKKTSVREEKSNQCYDSLPPHTTAEQALELCGPEFEE